MSDIIKRLEEVGLMGCFNNTGLNSGNYKEFICDKDMDITIKDLIYLHTKINKLHEKLDKFKWISVKDRLPPINKNVLFFNGKKEVRFGFYRPQPPPVDNWATEHSIWMDDLSYNEIGTATHWMPLPEKPHE